MNIKYINYHVNHKECDYKSVRRKSQITSKETYLNDSYEDKNPLNESIEIEADNDFNNKKPFSAGILPVDARDSKENL